MHIEAKVHLFISEQRVAEFCDVELCTAKPRVALQSQGSFIRFQRLA
jgi:hypothetical protein